MWSTSRALASLNALCDLLGHLAKTESETIMAGLLKQAGICWTMPHCTMSWTRVSNTLLWMIWMLITKWGHSIYCDCSPRIYGQFVLLIPETRQAAELTSGELHLPGYQLQFHDGKLRELQLIHPCYCIISLPEEHNIIGGVSICKYAKQRCDG